jgi:hypothetical protein
LEPLKNEELRIIGELVMTWCMIKQETHNTKDKLTTLIAWAIEEFFGK